MRCACSSGVLANLNRIPSESEFFTDVSFCRPTKAKAKQKKTCFFSFMSLEPLTYRIYNQFSFFELNTNFHITRIRPNSFKQIAYLLTCWLTQPVPIL